MQRRARAGTVSALRKKENEFLKIAMIHGQSHEGASCNIARLLAKKTGGDVTEFFLPRDFGHFCCGCTACFTKGQDKCPHYKDLAPITKALLEADVIILSSPVYVFHASGSMKAMLDHYGYMWMPHRPEEAMFAKQGVCISTAAGMGMGSTNKDMAHSLSYWGVGRVYKLGFAVAATDWESVSDKKRSQIEKKTDALAKKIKARQGRVKPALKTKFMFGIMRQFQKNGYNPMDMEYWKQKGWLGKDRPWKNK